MNCSSSNKNNESRASFSKNIKLRLKSKYIPDDFFPEQISIMTGKRNKCQIESGLFTPFKKHSYFQQNHNEQNLTSQQSKQNTILKKMIKIKEKNNIQSENGISSENGKKYSNSMKKYEQNQIIRKIISKEKNEVKNDNEIKKNKKGYSKKLIQYMEKMKKFININIAFDEDKYSFTKHVEQRDFDIKQNPESLETEDSPKLIRPRPKSEINSRERLISKLKIVQNNQKFAPKPIKIKVRDVNKIMRESKQSKQNKQTKQKRQNRYNKFIDIPLAVDGLLTFYGSPRSKQRYVETKSIKTFIETKSMRTSLPKLKK